MFNQSPKLVIRKLNESYVQLSSEPLKVLGDCIDAFKFRVPDYQHMPKYKAGFWDGYIKLIDMYGKCPAGISPEIVKWARDHNIVVDADWDILRKPISTEAVQAIISSFHLKYQPYDFQLEGVRTFLESKRAIILSPTASGKSFMLYLAARIMQKAGKKILVIVPSTSLVEQIYADFDDYASEDPTWRAEDHCHLIYQGKEKKTDKQIVISTWHSVYKMPKSFFEQWDVVIGDEVHELHSQAGESIFQQAVNAGYRMGMTGTLQKTKCHEMLLRGFVGQVTRVATTSELQEREILAPLKIKCLVLKHPKIPGSNSMPYDAEIEALVENQARNKFLVDLAGKCKGNTLVLVNNNDTHAVPLHKMIKEAYPERNVYLVHGNIKTAEKERIRQVMATEQDAIIVATYGSYQRGINIVGLKNLILGSPSKSIIRILQSIGRVLRKKKDGSGAIVFDIADDLRAGRAQINHTLKHYIERLEIYNSENFEVSIHERNI